MLDEPKSGLPTWAVVVIAVVVPIVIAVAFLTIFEWANRPMSAADYRADPQMGQKISDRNNALVAMHAIAQFASLVVGGLLIKPRSRVRVFLLIAVPISGLVFLISLAGLLAG